MGETFNSSKLDNTDRNKSSFVPVDNPATTKKSFTLKDEVVPGPDVERLAGGTCTKQLEKESKCEDDDVASFIPPPDPPSPKRSFDDEWNKLSIDWWEREKENIPPLNLS